MVPIHVLPIRALTPATSPGLVASPGTWLLESWGSSRAFSIGRVEHATEDIHRYDVYQIYQIIDHQHIILKGYDHNSRRVLYGIVALDLKRTHLLSANHEETTHPTPFLQGKLTNFGMFSYFLTTIHGRFSQFSP